ncbi:hypothetical protein [Halobacteriaceae bacterium SHR40]|uniref:hypothetical protein n=1 Tax=Halovenus amylolytica TaxID=2500550 RepID=UPI000FE2E2EB
MTNDALNDLSLDVANRFVRECKDRGDNPGDVLERLLLDYVRGEDLESKVTEIHSRVTEDDAPVLTDPETEAKPDVPLLDEYDPRDEGRLTKDALKQLTAIDESIAINPDHVSEDALPQSVQVKRELIKAIARYEYSVVKKYNVNTIANELLDIGQDYRRRDYVDPIWRELTVLDESNVKVTFLSDVDAALAWMDEQLAERGDEAETDLYWLASELRHSDIQIADEALDERLNRISLSVEGLHSPK